MHFELLRGFAETYSANICAGDSVKCGHDVNMAQSSRTNRRESESLDDAGDGQKTVISRACHSDHQDAELWVRLYCSNDF